MSNIFNEKELKKWKKNYQIELLIAGMIYIPGILFFKGNLILGFLSSILSILLLFLLPVFNEIKMKINYFTIYCLTMILVSSIGALLSNLYPDKNINVLTLIIIVLGVIIGYPLVFLKIKNIDKRHN